MTSVPGLGNGSRAARSRIRWAVPVVVAGVVAGGVVLSTGSSSAAPTLPARSATQLIADVTSASAAAFSGTVEEVANLGLPALPGGRSSASLSWQTFISGTHTARVWADGPDRQRVALLGELSEADVVHNGSDVWTYTSDTNTVSHTVLPARSHASDSTPPSAAELSPPAAAARLLKDIAPTTVVSVDASRRVAGRAAYTIAVRPRDARSTISRVTIAIDSVTHVPLQVQVFGAGSQPALQLGFTKVTFTAPPASIFAFRAPAGATVSTDPVGLRHQDGERPPAPQRAGGTPARTHAGPTGARPKVIGSGWTTVLELPDGLGAVGHSGLLDQLTSGVGTSGVRLLHTALINAVLLPDGRVFVGAVQPAALEHIAATTVG